MKHSIILWVVLSVLALACSGPQETEQASQVTQVAISTEVDLVVAHATVEVSANLEEDHKVITAQVGVSVLGLVGTLTLDWDLVAGTAQVCLRALTFSACRDLGP